MLIPAYLSQGPVMAPFSSYAKSGYTTLEHYARAVGHTPSPRRGGRGQEAPAPTPSRQGWDGGESQGEGNLCANLMGSDLARYPEERTTLT